MFCQPVLMSSIFKKTGPFSGALSPYWILTNTNTGASSANASNTIPITCSDTDVINEDGQFVCPKAGVLCVIGAIYTGTNGGVELTVTLRKNGTRFSTVKGYNYPGSYYRSSHFSAVLLVEEGDIIDLYITSGSFNSCQCNNFVIGYTRQPSQPIVWGMGQAYKTAASQNPILIRNTDSKHSTWLCDDIDHEFRVPYDGNILAMGTVPGYNPNGYGGHAQAYLLYNGTDIATGRISTGYSGYYNVGVDNAFEGTKEGTIRLQGTSQASIPDQWPAYLAVMMLGEGKHTYPEYLPKLAEWDGNLPYGYYHTTQSITTTSTKVALIKDGSSGEYLSDDAYTVTMPYKGTILLISRATTTRSGSNKARHSYNKVYKNDKLIVDTSSSGYTENAPITTSFTGLFHVEAGDELYVMLHSSMAATIITPDEVLAFAYLEVLE